MLSDTGDGAVDSVIGAHVVALAAALSLQAYVPTGDTGQLSSAVFSYHRPTNGLR